MNKHIIRCERGELAATADAVRNALATRAGRELRDAAGDKPGYCLYWQREKLNTVTLAALLQGLDVVFVNAQGRPIRAPRGALGMYLRQAALAIAKAGIRGTIIDRSCRTPETEVR